MKIILVGGETLGSVMPLIAVYQKLKEKVNRLEVLWIGASGGLEAKVVKEYLIDYRTITAGKLRRYFSWRNFFDIFKIFIGFIESFFIILTFKPEIIVGAGIFLQVPVMLAGKLLNKKILIHQQDRQKSFSNFLCEKIADKITVAFKKSLADFAGNKTILTGNPYRPEILTGKVTTAYQIFNLKQNLPTILILGGGTGALALNKLVVKSLARLTLFCQIIHLTGQNKQVNPAELSVVSSLTNYHPYEFLTDNLKHAYSAADLIISRAGLSTLTELSALSKPVILIPLPDSHQEDNAYYFKERGAALILNQKKINPKQLAESVKKMLNSQEQCFKLSANLSRLMPRNADELIAEEIIKLADVKIGVRKW